MATNVRRAACTPDAVFEVLADGWLYPSWVVGASRMRDVDDGWPAPETLLHHSVGTWPALLDGTTKILAWDPPRRVEMEARGWPIGTARVVIEAQPAADGCLIRIVEEVNRGPARALTRPLTDALIRMRNGETLHRLAYLAEGRGAGSSATSDAERGEAGEE